MDILKVAQGITDVYAAGVRAATESQEAFNQAAIRHAEQLDEIRAYIISELWSDVPEEWKVKPTIDLVRDLMERHHNAVQRADGKYRLQDERDVLLAAAPREQGHRRMTMRKTTAELATAAEQYLGIDITVTDTGRACHYADETNEGYWLTRKDLAYAKDCSENHGSDAYSHWCNSTGTPMSERSRRRVFGK